MGDEEFEGSDRSKVQTERTWSKQEDEIILLSIGDRLPDEPLWESIAAKLENRTSQECEEHWEKHLTPPKKTGPLTPDEWKIIQESRKTLGNSWSRIAKLLPGRTRMQVKNSFHARKRRHKRRKKIEQESSSSSPESFESDVKRRKIVDLSFSVSGIGLGAKSNLSAQPGVGQKSPQGMDPGLSQNCYGEYMSGPYGLIPVRRRGERINRVLGPGMMSQSLPGQSNLPVNQQFPSNPYAMHGIPFPPTGSSTSETNPSGLWKPTASSGNVAGNVPVSFVNPYFFNPSSVPTQQQQQPKVFPGHSHSMLQQHPLHSQAPVSDFMHQVSPYSIPPQFVPGSIMQREHYPMQNLAMQQHLFRMQQMQQYRSAFEIDQRNVVPEQFLEKLRKIEKEQSEQQENEHSSQFASNTSTEKNKEDLIEKEKNMDNKMMTKEEKRENNEAMSYEKPLEGVIPLPKQMYSIPHPQFHCFEEDELSLYLGSPRFSTSTLSCKTSENVSFGLKDKG